MAPHRSITYGLAPLSLAVVLRPLLPGTGGPLPALSASVGFAGLALSMTLVLIPLMAEAFRKARFEGKDMLKKDGPLMCVCLSVTIPPGHLRISHHAAVAVRWGSFAD